MRVWQCISLAGIVVGLSSNAFAQSSLLNDRNGDNVVRVVAIGDSITFGVGDERAGGGGYPSRTSSLLGVPVENEGVPGETLVSQGVFRIPSEVRSSSADVVVILEGANDANLQTSTGQFRNALQRSINVSRAIGSEIVLGTPQEPCCDKAPLATFTRSLASVVREVASVNDLRVADFEKAWQTTCTSPLTCGLYNLPEGLHPNSRGYTVMAQTLAATLLGIDIFAPGGAAELESALGLPAGTVIVKPETAQ